MASFTSGVRQITRFEYRVPVPTNAVEVDKAITAATLERTSRGAAISDDMLQVRVEDDAIVIWWEEQ